MTDTLVIREHLSGWEWGDGVEDLAQKICVQAASVVIEQMLKYEFSVAYREDEKGKPYVIVDLGPFTANVYLTEEEDGWGDKIMAGRAKVEYEEDGWNAL